MAALAPASNIRPAPSLPLASTEDSKCKKVAQVIAKIAIHILAPLAAAFLVYLALPLSISVIVTPIAAIATIFALTFFFHVEQEEPVLPLSATAPCGLANMGGSDCWLNSLAQLIRIDQGMRKWFTEVPRKLAEHAGYLEYFSQELLENLPEQLPEEVYLKLAEKGVDTPDARQKLDEYAVRIRRLNPGQKQRLFRYLRFLRPGQFNDGRPSANLLADALIAFKKFMQAYDAYDAGVRRAAGQVLRAIPVRNRPPLEPPARPRPPAPFNSHELRQVLVRVSRGFIDEHSQIDLPEGVEAVLPVLIPDELQVQVQERRHYDLPRKQGTNELQPLVDPPERGEIRDERIVVVNEPTIAFQCPMLGSFPSIEHSLACNFEDLNHEPGTRITRTIDEIEYEFPLVKVERQFLIAPTTLWLLIKRFQRVEPQWAGLHRMMPNWFDAQPADQIKDERPMTVQEILTIQPVQGGPARYKLDGFICHLGKIQGGGHYISYRLGKDDEGREAWFKMNDAVVTRISDAQMRKALETAYLPHYSKIED